MPRLPAVTGRILIVDDDERRRNALAAMLSECDFDTQVASDGQEALERGDLTPAIALTGFGSMERALSAAHDLKAFWFLEKPVEPRAFKTLLERAIRYKKCSSLASHS
ncbi:MAG: hypothetical protein ABSE56_04925 [Bryobacteraceae bacterium]|jgi:DNA-binding NtrC family response regulator